MASPEHEHLPRGAPLPDWTPRPLPPREILQGRTARLEPLDPVRHGDDLVAAFRNTPPESWTYLFHGPHTDEPSIRQWLATSASADGYVCYAIVDLASSRALGIASYMRMDPANGVIEVGSIHYSDAMKHTVASTEAMFLMMRHVFDDLGYRRFEWKCDSHNAPSRRMALRLGFSFEGIFRNHIIVKGHSRDTAWFAMTNDDWPNIRAAYETWLAPENFDASEQQRSRLAASSEPAGG